MTQPVSSSAFVRRRLVRRIVPAFAALLLVFAVQAHAADRHVERRVPPVYPELAKRMRVAGIVRIEATVGPDGTVTAAKALSGNRMLSPAAEEAVKHWKFASGDGESVVDIDINFELN